MAGTPLKRYLDRYPGTEWVGAPHKHRVPEAVRGYWRRGGENSGSWYTYSCTL